jgi:hypothetical protein
VRYQLEYVALIRIGITIDNGSFIGFDISFVATIIQPPSTYQLGQCDGGSAPDGFVARINFARSRLIQRNGRLRNRREEQTS